jgi:hypothetical protein
MSEVNYSETVIVPLLQKKYQELINSNLILEVNLLVEREKNKKISLELEELKNKLEKQGKRSKKGDITEDGGSY